MPKADQRTDIDPIILARFLVMPGVEPLLDAFGRIPPGPMRDSVIHLARTLADQYSNAPAGQSMPDPLLLAAGFVATPEAPAGEKTIKPKDALPPTLEGPEAEVIRRRKKKQHAQQIAAETGIARVTVDKIIAAAKAAGVTFPNLRNLAYKKGRPLEHKEWHTSLDSMTGQALSRVHAAAETRGITPEEYLRRKLVAVDMAMNGAQYPAIEAATESDQKTISLWLSNARAAGLKVPYVARWFIESDLPPPSEQAAHAVEPAAPVDNVIRPSRFFGPFTAVGVRQAPLIARAAARRNLTPDAYLDLQESIVRQRMSGLNPAKIVVNTGTDLIFVKDALQQGRKNGAVYPPCAKGWSVAKAG